MITTQIDDLVGRPTGVKTQAFLYVLCGLAEAAVYVALLPLLRSLIAGDYVAAGYLVALAAALALLHSVIGFFADNRGYYIGIEQICHALQDALGDHIVRLPLGWFTKERSGQVAALLTKALQMAMDVPSTFLRQMVIAVTTPAAVVVLFLFVDWRIGLVFVIAAPLLLWASRAMAKAAGEGHRQEELSNAEVAARVLEFAHAQPVLRATKRSVEGWDALQQAIERDRAATVATLRMASAPVARYTMLIQVVFAVVFATATALLAWGQIDVASYVFVAILPEVLKVGASAMLMQVLVLVQQAIAYRAAAAWGGAEWQVLLGAALRIQAFAFIPLWGMSNGLQPAAGTNYGAGLYGRVRKLTIVFCLGSMALALLFWVPAMLAPEATLSLLVSDPAVAAMGADDFRVFFSTYLVAGPMVMGITLLQALGQGGKAAILTFARPVALFVPLVLILPNVAGLGIHGVWAASALSDGVMIVVAAFMVASVIRNLGKDEGSAADRVTMEEEAARA